MSSEDMNPLPLVLEGISKKYKLKARQRSLRGSIWNKLRERSIKSSETSPDDIMWALKDIDLSVRRGEAVGLVGPNGAGKTTLLKIISGVTKPTQGRLEINGRVAAMIELGAGFHPDLSGKENIYLNAAILGLSRSEISRKFDGIVSFSGLEDFIDVPVKRYSSGMYVRLAFAVAANVEPDILLIDEVLAVGDAAFRWRCTKRIESLRKGGATIVLVSHNPYLVQSICDKAVFISSGRIRSTGDPVKVLNSYEASIGEALAIKPVEAVLNQPQITSSTYLEISEVKLHTDGDKTNGAFQHSDSVEVRVFYRSKEVLDQPNLIVRFVRADGTSCSMIRTRDYGFELGPVHGEGFLAVSIDPLQLAGGTYAIDARICGKLDGVPLAHGFSDWFRVEGITPGSRPLSGTFVPAVTSARSGSS